MFYQYNGKNYRIDIEITTDDYCTELEITITDIWEARQVYHDFVDVEDVENVTDFVHNTLVEVVEE